jgi:hypothetical protein
VDTDARIERLEHVVKALLAVSQPGLHLPMGEDQRRVRELRREFGIDPPLSVPEESDAKSIGMAALGAVWLFACLIGFILVVG